MNNEQTKLPPLAFITSYLTAISQRKEVRDEAEIFESAAQLSLQVRGASDQFERKVNKIGNGGQC